MKIFCFVLLVLALIGCAPVPEGSYCAEDSVLPLQTTITIRETDGGLAAEILDPIVPVQGDCTLEPLQDGSRYVGTCTDPIVPCESCGITIDVVDEDTIYVSYVGLKAFISRSSAVRQDVLATRCAS
jgi:hypothetical protein